MKTKYQSLSFIEGWLSIVINTILFSLKYWVGVMTGSIAIIADAWHTLSDSLTSLVVIIGAKASMKPADIRHPFGHGRAELIASVIIGVLLSVVGFNFFSEAIQKLRNHETAAFNTLAVVVFSVSAVLKEALAQFSFWAGEKARSKALKADGWHHRSDAIASAIILIGVFLGTQYWWIDGVLGIIVALLIGYAAFEILKETVSPLMGESPDDQLVVRIKEIVSGIAPEKHNIHHLHMHRYGSHTEITLHLRLDGSLNLRDSHLTVTRIESAIHDELDIEATIHMEPDPIP